MTFIASPAEEAGLFYCLPPYFRTVADCHYCTLLVCPEYCNAGIQSAYMVSVRMCRNRGIQLLDAQAFKIFDGILSFRIVSASIRICCPFGVLISVESTWPASR